ncbi:MAG: hypothetical protein ABIJ97_06650 [Bacteroidota bacterium]
MQNRLLVVVIGVISCLTVLSQTSDSTKTGLEISGYIQAQYQHFVINDTTGSVPKHFAKYYGGNFVNDVTCDRFMIRRGRLKFTHRGQLTKGVLSCDFTEKGFSVKDIYIDLTEKYLKAFTFSGGLFSRSFGHEVEYSASLIESPERSLVVQHLFPGERDLGLKFNFNMPEKSPLHFLSLDAAIINGNGSAVETDNYKDFIGRINLSSNKENEKFYVSFGASFYSGSVNHIYEPVDTVASNTARKYSIYRFGEYTDTVRHGVYIDSLWADTNVVVSYKGFKVDTATTYACGTTGGKVKREYYGIHGELRVKSPFGRLTIRGEYITGTQPSAVNTNQFDKPTVIYNDMNSASPSGPITGVSWPVHKVPQPYRPVSVGSKEIPHNTLVRKFNGGYIYFIQDIMETGHQIVIKYDWYDPNSEIEGKDIDTDYIFDTTDSLPNTYLSPADVKISTFGIGWNWQVNENVMIMLYYENIKNEITEIDIFEGDIASGWYPHPGMMSDIRNDLITIRLQYKF